MPSPLFPIFTRSAHVLRTVSSACVALLTAVGCGSEAPVSAPPPPEVIVTPVVKQDVPVYGEWVGTTQGFIDARIRPQVEGYLLERHFREGGRVKKGDLLFTIDPREFQAELDNAKGELGQAQAMLGKSRLDVERYTPLAKVGAVSQQELDDAVQAKLDLAWARIEAPIDGIVGVAEAQVGDLVTPDTMLTTLSQLDPIKVEFPISEQEYLAVSRRAKAEGRSIEDLGEETLELILADGSTFPHRGTASIVGREVDPTTGTIEVQGVFKNPGNVLRPGQYAKIRAVVTNAEGALLVPQRAVREVQGRRQVAVVGSDDMVELRPVETGPRSGELWVLAKGVKPGERVIVEGLQKVKAGTKVSPKAAGKSKSAPSAAQASRPAPSAGDDTAEATAP